MLQLRESKDIAPVCPHCSQTIAEMLFRELKGMLGKRYVYFCVGCKKVLGVSHRKGLFMG